MVVEFRQEMTVERVALAYHEVQRIHLAGRGRSLLDRVSGRFVTWRLQQAFAPAIRRAPYTLEYDLDLAGRLTVRSPLAPQRDVLTTEFQRAIRGAGVICLFARKSVARRVLYFQNGEQEAALLDWIRRGRIEPETVP